MNTRLLVFLGLAGALCILTDGELRDCVRLSRYDLFTSSQDTSGLHLQVGLQGVVPRWARLVLHQEQLRPV